MQSSSCTARILQITVSNWELATFEEKNTKAVMYVNLIHKDKGKLANFKVKIVKSDFTDKELTLCDIQTSNA